MKDFKEIKRDAILSDIKEGQYKLMHDILDINELTDRHTQQITELTNDVYNIEQRIHFAIREHLHVDLCFKNKQTYINVKWDNEILEQLLLSNS